MTIQEHVEQIGTSMVGVLHRGLRAGAIPLDRAQQIAQFYLQKLKMVQTEDELNVELKQMESTMPEMQTVVNFEKARVKESQDQLLRQQADELLKQGKIEEAAQLAKQVT